MCHNMLSNSICIPISKQTLTLQLLEPLTHLIESFWTLSSARGQTDNMSIEQIKQLMTHLEETCSRLALSGGDMLEFLHCITEQTKEVTAARTAPNQEKWLSILIVDDDERIQKFHRSMLESINCSVSIANNGYEALSMLCKPYDAILMDIQMPGMDGVETAIKIRQQSSNLMATPIIAVTTNPLEEMQENLKASIFNESLQKPIDINTLQKTLRTLTMAS